MVAAVMTSSQRQHYRRIYIAHGTGVRVTAQCSSAPHGLPHYNQCLQT